MSALVEESKYSPFRWFILLCFVTSNIAVMSVLIGPASIVFRIAEDLRVDVGKATLIVMALANCFLVLGNVASGFVIDRLGLTRTWIIGLTLALFGSAMWPVLGDSVAGVVAMRVIAGLSAATLSASVASLSGTWFRMSERAIVTGVASSSAALGVSVGLIAVPAFLAKTSNWRTAMACLAVLVALALVLNVVAFFGSKPAVSQGRRRKGATVAADFKAVWKLPATYAICGVGFCGGWVALAFNVMMPNYLGMPAPVGQGLGALRAGAFVSLVPYGQAAGSLLSGVVFDKIFRGNAGRALSVTMATTGVLCFSVISRTVTHNGAILSPLLVGTGMLIGMVPPMLFTFLAKTYPATVMGSLGGIFQAVVSIGGTAGVALGAAVLSIAGRYTASTTLLLIVSCTGAVVANLLLAPRSNDVAPPGASKSSVTVEGVEFRRPTHQ